MLVASRPMSTDQTQPGAALDTLRVALNQLRALAALPSAEPFYTESAQQVAAIVAELEKRTTPQPADGLFPDPPSPG